MGLEKGLGLGSVYLINGSKLAYFLEESSMSMKSPETSHIMALKIKDYIISSLFLANHYLRLIVVGHSYSGPGLSGLFARSRRVHLSWRLGIVWLIVADHDCMFWLYLYGPDLLYLYLLLYYTLHPTAKVDIFRPV